MSTYRIREKIFSWGDDFTVQDEHGRDAMRVDGKAFTMRDRLRVLSMSGEELADIHRKVLSWGPTYIIDRGGQRTEIRKHLFTLFRAKFTLDVPGPNDLEAEGNLWDREYTIKDSRGRLAARISKKFFSFTDSYGVQVQPGADDVLMVCAAIVIDRCSHEDRD